MRRPYRGGDRPPAAPVPRDLASTLTGLLAASVAAVGATAGAIYLRDDEAGDLRLMTAQGLPPAAAGHRLAPGEGLLGRVVEEGRSLVSGDVPVDPRALHRRPDWDQPPLVRSFLGVPLRTGAVVLGAIELTHPDGDAFAVEDRGRASILADAAALLIERTQLTSAPPPAALGEAPLGGSEPIGIATLDRRLAVTSVNAAFARLVAQPAEALYGRPAIAVLPTLGRPQARDALEAALHGAPAHLSGQHEAAADRGSEALSVSIIPLGDRQRGIHGVMLAAQDVSERVRLEAELRAQHARAVEARDRLRAVVEVVSHELRTPLTSVLGYAHLLHDRSEATDEQRAHWAALVIDKARMMARLMDDITDLARLGAERIELRREPTDVGALVERAVRELQVVAEGADQPPPEITLEVAPETPTVELDPDRIAQVLTNLIGNALKYGPTGGPVEVTVGPTATGDGVRVSVADRGPGLSAEEAERVFEPFYRTPDARGTAGTGLGLAISRGLVEAHGGELSYAPRAEGGARFTFVLPR